MTNRAAIKALLRQRLPGLLAIYAFGCRVAGTVGPASDLDLAVLVGGYADPLQRWELAGCPVDLLDFRAASTVMQYASLQLPITIRIIEAHLDEFLDYAKAILLRDSA